MATTPVFDADLEGWRLPAEWESHEATWLGWPHGSAVRRGRSAPLLRAYGQIVKTLADGERVRILVPSREHEAKARHLLQQLGAASERVVFHRWPTDRGWTRHIGPICVLRGQPHAEVAVARFRFTAWARYPDFRKDDQVAERAARGLSLKLRRVVHNGRPVVLEGGAVDVDGGGTLLATEECLLDPFVQVRNPGFRRDDYEHVFADAFGVRRAIWLGKGIAGDHTHGHVDNLCRFVRPRTILLCHEPNGGDANHRPLSENRERFQDVRLADGSKPEIVPLPMPAPRAVDGQRLPASYASFYVANAVVLVPTFDDPSDALALGTLRELFPDRSIVALPALDLLRSFGTLHGVTRQQPQASAISLV